MINVKDEHCKCGKSTRPNFNYSGLKPEYCSKCKEVNMIDLTHARCKCGKVQPSFNYEGLMPEYCKDCKKEGMIMLRKRKCVKCKEKQATYNLEGLKAKYCNSCKTDEMINVKTTNVLELVILNINIIVHFVINIYFQMTKQLKIFTKKQKKIMLEIF